MIITTILSLFLGGAILGLVKDFTKAATSHKKQFPCRIKKQNATLLRLREDTERFKDMRAVLKRHGSQCSVKR